MKAKRKKKAEGLKANFRAIEFLTTAERALDEFAKHLGIQRRSAYRVIQRIQEAGLEVQTRQEGKQVLHRITATSARRVLGLSR